jgi:hypothetical protein
LGTLLHAELNMIRTCRVLMALLQVHDSSGGSQQRDCAVHIKSKLDVTIFGIEVFPPNLAATSSA